MLFVNENISIHEKELKFTFSRSSGPGGQHVNTADTRVTLLFDIDRSRSLTQLQKVILKGKLRRRIGKDGKLRVTARDTRSQHDNRELAVARFIELVRGALEPVMERMGTRVPRSQKRKRLQRKKRRAQVKSLRRPPGREE